MRKGGGEEARSVRCMCDMCAAHGDRADVGVDVDAQGSLLSGCNPGRPPKIREPYKPEVIIVGGMCGSVHAETIKKNMELLGVIESKCNEA